MSYFSASAERMTAGDNFPNALPVSATAPGPAPDFSSRSCVTCRRRKVRCNKRSPCSNCLKTGTDCVFPPPGRAPRRSKREPDAELLSRLRRLEGVIEHLSGKNRETNSTSVSPTRPTPSHIPSAVSSAATATATATVTPPAPAPAEPKDPNGNCPYEDLTKLGTGKFENEFGRLVVDEGRSRYVSNRLWASLGDEIEELQDILGHSSSEEEDYPSPESSHSSSHDGFLFGFYSLSHSLREYHPPFPNVSVFWDTYKENVAPLITIIHKPTVRKLLVEAAQNPDSLDKNSEALVFSIYLSAVISLNPGECLARLGEERNLAVKRYRFAVEQALAKANLLNTQNLALLQAAVLFLICVRREDDSKFVWSMNSIILRLAQGLGLHRDGTKFGLKPFETEMRRRLWWHICLLDIRSSEDHGTDPLIHDGMYDTRLPLNVNDDDIYPEMTETPTEREGYTDVTFCLVRCEITWALRRMNYSCPGSRAFKMFGTSPSIERCEKMIQIVSSRVEERYIKHCNMDIPIHWASATVARLILAKLWLIVHHPMTRKDRITNVSQESRERLFLTAIEVLEFGHLLEADPRTAKWGWLFRTNMQWHGVAFVLSEVCVRPIGPVTDRAWNAINSLYSDWTLQTTHKRGMLWQPLAALMKRAVATRAKQQEELRTKCGLDPIPLKSATESFATLHHNTLPQIHMPITSPSSSKAQTDQTAPLDPMSIDLASGQLDTLKSLFPGTNFLAPVILDDLPPQGPVSAVNPPAGLPLFNTPMSNPFMTQENLPEAPPLSWEEWDQVMRDFQMDVEREDETVPERKAHVTEWFA